MTDHLTRCAVVAALLGASGAAHASFALYGVNSKATSTTLHGTGDRQLNQLGFVGNSTLFTDADLTRFDGGSLVCNKGPYSWADEAQRDMNTKSHGCWANPDRADVSSPFTGEAGSTGRLNEVFGSPLGYKNLSWIIDGEDNRTYTLDLHLSALNHFTVDSDPSTIEFAFLERGGNSDIAVQGITGFDDNGMPILTPAIVITRKQTTRAGWTLNTLEIGGAQQVEGAGLSLPSEWGTLVGVRLENRKGFNGPDIVAVAMIPTPGSAALAGLAGLLVVRRRRA
jgi:hypothetical protein